MQKVFDTYFIVHDFHGKKRCPLSFERPGTLKLWTWAFVHVLNMVLEWCAEQLAAEMMRNRSMGRLCMSTVGSSPGEM